MLYFHVTGRLLRALKVKPTGVRVPDRVNWLDCWYVRDIPLDLPLGALLFTNAETFYSLVHPFDRRERIDEIVDVFQQRLEYITGRDFTSDPGAFRVCKAASRRVLGCMNELALMVEYEVDCHLQGEGVRLEAIEHLNEGIVGGLFPKQEFWKRIRNEKSQPFKPTKTPYLRFIK